MIDRPVCGNIAAMTETDFQIIKSIGFVAALVLAISIQRIRPHRALAGSWRTNAGLWAVNAVTLGLVCGGCACLAARWAEGEGLGLLHGLNAPSWLAVIVSVLALDAVSYFWHRANHRLPLLWRFHQAHHSDVDYTVTTALRFHPGELLLALPIRLAAVVALGVPIGGIIVFELVFAFANFVEHGNISLPAAFEQAMARVIVTPALHRRHHSIESDELNSNYGTIFTFWDRLFGSYGENRSDVRIETGLPALGRHLGTGEVLALPIRGSFRGR